MAQYQGSFHFVNKNASNLNRRNKEEAFSISSHVTNKYYRWAKGHKSKLLAKSDAGEHSNLESDDGPSSDESYGSDQRQSSLRVRAHRSRSSRLSCKAMTWQLESGVAGSRSHSPNISSNSDTGHDGSWDEEDDRPLSKDAGVLLRKTSLLYQPDSSTAADPVACPTLRKEALGTLQGFFRAYSTTTGKTSHCRQIADMSWKQREADLLRDPKSLYGWFGSFLTLRALYVDPDSYTVLWPQALRHQNSAVALLRSTIINGQDYGEEILTCIWKISALSFYAGDMEAVGSHADFQRNYIASLGGLDALSPMTRTHVILGENANCRFRLTRPYYHHSLFDPGSFQEQSALQKYIPLMPELKGSYQRWDEAFLLPDDDLSETLASYILAHREFLAASALASSMTSSDPEGAHAISSWLMLRRAGLSGWTMSLFCDLTESMTPQTRLSRVVRRQLQASLCLAVSCLWSIILGFNAPLQQWLLYVPIHKLRSQLEILLQLMSKRLSGGATPAPTSRAPKISANSVSHRDCLLFLFFTGSCAEQLGDDAGKREGIKGKWHSERFVELSKILGLRTWREAKRVLVRFIYKEEVLDRFVEGVWEGREALRVGAFL